MLKQKLKNIWIVLTLTKMGLQHTRKLLTAHSSKTDKKQQNTLKYSLWIVATIGISFKMLKYHKISSNSASLTYSLKGPKSSRCPMGVLVHHKKFDDYNHHHFVINGKFSWFKTLNLLEVFHFIIIYIKINLSFFTRIV